MLRVEGVELVGDVEGLVDRFGGSGGGGEDDGGETEFGLTWVGVGGDREGTEDGGDVGVGNVGLGVGDLFEVEDHARLWGSEDAAEEGVRR